MTQEDTKLLLKVKVKIMKINEAPEKIYLIRNI